MVSPYTWNEVGHLLQAFEGFQVKMVMKDLADDLEWMVKLIFSDAFYLDPYAINQTSKPDKKGVLRMISQASKDSFLLHTSIVGIMWGKSTLH